MVCYSRNHTPNRAIIPRIAQSYPESRNHTPNRAIMPRIAQSYPESRNHTPNRAIRASSFRLDATELSFSISAKNTGKALLELEKRNVKSGIP